MRRALRQDVSALTLSSQPVGRSSPEPPDLDPEALRAARRQLIVNSTGLVASSFGFGLVFGLT
ncbi:MAG: hypothetical protein ACHQXL_09475, partial [Candidatus Limnocylindrales bacterium]